MRERVRAKGRVSCAGSTDHPTQRARCRKRQLSLDFASVRAADSSITLRTDDGTALPSVAISLSGKVRVTAFENDRVLATAEGAFANVSTERSALDLPLDGKNVTRVRAEVLSVLGQGGGFAEVEVD